MALRVLLISHRADATGAPRSLSILLEHWRRTRGWAARVLLAEDGPRRGMFMRLCPTDAWPAGERYRELLLEDLRRFDPDVIYSNTGVNGEVLRRLDGALGRRVPVVCHVRELGWTLSKLGPADRATLRERTDLFLAASEPVRDHLVAGEGVDPASIRLGPVCVEGAADRAAAAAVPRAEVEAELGIGPATRLLGNAGFVGRRKGPDLFVEAAAKLLDTADDPARPLHFVWLGDGPDRDAVQRRARRLGVADRVRFPGLSDGPHPVLARMDLLLMTSRDDPFPRTVIECANHGVPAVAYAEAGGAGRFVEPPAGDEGRWAGEAPAGVAVAGPPASGPLAAAAAELLADEPRRRALGDRARERAASLEVSAVAPALADEVEALAAAHESADRRPDRPFSATVRGLWSRPPTRVSVLMTSYNYERYVGEAIRSVAAQTVPPAELVVVDDGSVDGSVAAIEAEVARGVPFPVKVISQRNAGQASALNRALAEAEPSADAVAFLDSDDRWTPDRLERTLAQMAAHPGGGLYQHQLGDGAGGIKKALLLSGDVFRQWECRGAVDASVKPRAVMLFNPTTALTVHRAVAEAVFPLPASLVTCPDAYLTRTAVRWGPLVSDHATLGIWRKHASNAGGSGKYGFERFWAPVILPTINEHLRASGATLRIFASGTTPPAPAGAPRGGDLKHAVVTRLARLGLEPAARRLLGRPAKGARA